MSDQTYEQWVRERAAELGSDGCSFGFGAFAFCCLEHDVAYRLGHNRDGQPVSKDEADNRFRACIQRKSKLGWWSPIAWWRWLAVHWFGKPSAPRSAPERTIDDVVEIFHEDALAEEAAQRRMAILREVFGGR